MNVRADTNTKSAKVGRLERGTHLTVTGVQMNNAGEIWYAVRLNDGTEGYIRSDLLEKVEQENFVQKASESEGAKESSQFVAFKAKTTQSAVNVRTEASTKGSKAGQISQGQILTVISQVINSAGETWYAVKLSDGTEGFIRSDLLIETNETQEQQAAYQTTQKKTTNQTGSSKSGSGQYIGNKNSKKFHRISCRSLPKESNRVYFSSREKAVSSGYVACKICKP